MVSFLSTLFILVLANGYFTLPVPDEQSSSPSYFPSFHDIGGETTESARSLGFVHKDNETNEMLPVKSMRGLPVNLVGSEMEATTERLSEENASRGPRMFNDNDLFEPLDHTTGLSDMEERSWDESLYTTDETATIQHKFSERNVESTTEINSEGEHHHGDAKREEHDDDHSKEQSQYKREVTMRQQTMRDESTTPFMTSFASTSSAIAPQLYSATKKYPGLFRDDQDNEKVPSSSDDSSSTVAIAAFDPTAMNNIVDTQDPILMYDDKKAYVVTDFPSLVSTSTMENNDLEKPTPIPFREGNKQSRL